jgi:thiamine pyrophosphate-dependent acetolactate synthase large subunit-like protein
MSIEILYLYVMLLLVELAARRKLEYWVLCDASTPLMTLNIPCAPPAAAGGGDVQVLLLLKAARRPLLLLGGGAVRVDCALMNELVEVLDMPVAYTWVGKVRP